MMCQPSETAICWRAGSRPGGPSLNASTSARSLSHIGEAVPILRAQKTCRFAGYGWCSHVGSAAAPTGRVAEVMPLTDVAIESKPNMHKPKRSLVRVPVSHIFYFIARPYTFKLQFSRTEQFQLKT